MQRIQIIGGSGAGKTTLGRQLARALDLPFTDLDDLYWEPGWREVGHEEFGRRLQPLVAGPRWVIAGNYNRSTETIAWPRLDTLIVLDLPFGLMMRRTVWRGVVRGFTGQACCNGNRESLLRLFHHDGVVRYLARTWRARHAHHATLAQRPDLAHVRVIRVESNSALAPLLAPAAAAR